MLEDWYLECSPHLFSISNYEGCMHFVLHFVYYSKVFFFFLELGYTKP
jgi:hypothetical protein